MNLPATSRGVIITAIDPNANAAEQGLQRGDLIVSINNQPVMEIPLASSEAMRTA